MADEKLEIDITAKDDASKVIDPLTKKVDQLEKSDPEVEVAADTRTAQSDVDTFAGKLKKLSDSDQVVVLALRAGNIQSELTDLATELATIDTADPTIDVKLDRFAELSGDLDQIEAQMKDIAGTSLDPDVSGVAKKRLEDIGTAAGNAQGAVHSMAGNAIGDMAATASGIGPVGEALGQLVEQAAGGEAGLKSLATAGLGIGAITGGIALVNTLIGHFRDEAKKTAEIEAFNVKNVQAYADLILKVNGDLDTLSEKPDTAGMTARMADVTSQTQALIDTWAKAGEVKAFDPVTGEIENMLPVLDAAKISAQDWAKAIVEGPASQASLGILKDSTLAMDEQRAIMLTLAAQQQAYTEGVRDADQKTRFFTDTTDSATRQVGKYKDQIDDQTTALGKSKTNTDKMRGALDELTDSTKAADAAYGHMSDTISQDQSLIDLANQMDDVQSAAEDAWKAQADANQAIKQNASDATEKQREAEQSMRDYQSAVNSAKQDIISLGQTAGATPVEVSAALKKIDEGDLAGAKADAEAWSRRNPVQISVKLADLGAALQKAAAGLNATVTAGSTQVTNNFLAAAATGRQLRATSARWQRINGR